MKKIFTIISTILVLFFLESCSTDIQIKINKDGSTNIEFSGSSGEAISRMIKSATGNDFMIDPDEIKSVFEKDGFINVQTVCNGFSNLKVSLTDKNKSSYLFSSGLLFENESGGLDVNFTSKNLKDFYDSLDEQSQGILDLFIAPVFNNEVMSESEYIETFGSFYGNEYAKEIEKSVVTVELISSTGSKIMLEYRLTELLSGNL